MSYPAVVDLLYDHIKSLNQRVKLLEQKTIIQEFIAECDEAINERGIMPNSVSYSDEKTLTKVYTALAGNGEMDFPTALDVVTRLQNAGILFREEAEVVTRGPRKKNADGSDQTEVPQPQLAQENPGVF